MQTCFPCRGVIYHVPISAMQTCYPCRGVIYHVPISRQIFVFDVRNVINHAPTTKIPPLHRLADNRYILSSAAIQSEIRTCLWREIAL